MSKRRDMTEEQLMQALSLMGDIDKDQRAKITCVLIGHSHIVSSCFGYVYCGRCGEQLADGLGGYPYDTSEAVIIGHACPKCHENYDKLGWQDKLFALDPFAKEYEEGQPVKEDDEP